MLNLRIDRALSVYVAHPLARGLKARRGARIPILMYHSISDGRSHQHPYYETSTSPQVFAQHMKFLQEEGYQALSLDEVLEGASGRTSAKSVVITFDDGYADFYRYAFPVLSEHHLTATVFVITGLLKAETASFKGTKCLTVSQVRELHSHGITIGSHTVSHPHLNLLPQDAIENELSMSKQTLEDALGAPVQSFSCPFAFPEADRGFVSRLAGLLSKCGYQNGVTTILGTVSRNPNRWFLPRLPANSWDDLALFEAKLEGSYDWLHLPQRIYKALKNHDISARSVMAEGKPVDLPRA